MNRPNAVEHVETFRPRMPRFLAMGWYAIAVFAGYDLVSRGEGRSVPIGLAALALVTVVVYAIAQRPAIVADPRGVLLRNVVRDVWLPWHAVKGIETRWSLSIETADASYGSWAMTGASASRPRRPRSLGAAVRPPTPSRAHEVVWTVPDKLEQLRRRGLHGDRTGTVERRTAWPVLGALGVTLAVLVVLLVAPAS